MLPSAHAWPATLAGLAGALLLAGCGAAPARAPTSVRIDAGATDVTCPERPQRACARDGNAGAYVGGKRNDAGSSEAVDLALADLAVADLAAAPLTGSAGTGYTATVTLDGQSLALLVDTGSSTLAVADAACATCGAVPRFKAPAPDDAAPLAVGRYADNSGWRGRVQAMQVVLAAPTASANPATPARSAAPPVALPVARITQQVHDFVGGAASATFAGILGLGGQAGASLGTAALMEKLASSAALAHDAFALQLCPNGGQLWFGGYDPAALAPSAALQWTPLRADVDAAGGYAVDLVGAALGPLPLLAATVGPVAAHVDTATTALLLPPSVVAALADALQALPDAALAAPLAALFAPGATSPRCTELAAVYTPAVLDELLAPLTLQLAGATSTALPTVLHRPATASYLAVQPQRGSETWRYCAAVHAADVIVLGTPTWTDHVLVVDRAHKQLGIAPATCPARL